LEFFDMGHIRAVSGELTTFGNPGRELVTVHLSGFARFWCDCFLGMVLPTYTSLLVARA
jgi:hypothetical protein